MTLWKPVGLVAVYQGARVVFPQHRGGLGFLAGISVLAVTSFPFRLGPDSAGWSRLVKGVSAKGNVDQSRSMLPSAPTLPPHGHCSGHGSDGLVLLPGINRRSAPNIFINFEQEPLARATLVVSVDGVAEI